MKKTSIIFVSLSGLGFLMSLIALILLGFSENPFIPTELPIDVLLTHPLVWAVISGSLLLVAISDLMKQKNKNANED